MGDVSKQFSLREIIGSVAPGAMVLSAILWVWLKVDVLPSSLSGWSGLLIGFVLAYGIGTILTSLTQSIFAAVTQLRTAAPLGPPDAQPSSLLFSGVASRSTAKSERFFRLIDRMGRRVVSYLSGGQDVASSIRQFRESWQKRAVEERIVSEHALSLAAGHYRTLFEADPAGEESLLFCELYIRDRLPSAMLEIEQNAAKAALMGNLIIPMLFWLIAVGVGIVLPLIVALDQEVVRNIMELVFLGALLVLFPYIVRMIGRQWVEASRNHVRIIILTFTIACRLSAGAKPPEARASFAA